MSAAGDSSSNTSRSEKVVHLREAFKLALSLVLFYWLALWMNWDLPKYGALAIVLVSLDTTGASSAKGIMRVVGTTVGVAVGFLVLGLLNQDRWATMLAFASYLTVIGYFMLGSRYKYAWFCAGFVPLVVWAVNYPRFDSVFYFGTFRWLETTVGILIYTTVSMMLWPRRAGDRLKREGEDLWAGVRGLFDDYRQQLLQRELPAGAAELRAKVAGSLARTMSTLQDAYADTPEVSRKRRVWEVWRTAVRTFVDALELWRESIGDCRELDLDRLLPQLNPALEMLDNRLRRIGLLWGEPMASEDAPATDDNSQPEPLTVELDRSAAADLSHLQRAAVVGCVAQLEVLDQTSRELLRAMRVLAGLEHGRGSRVSSPQRDRFRPSGWDLGRLMEALLPAAAFIAGFFLWVFIYPPTGPLIPMFAGILSLVILQTPANPLALVGMFLLTILVVVAPVYFLVMPGLSTGFELLGFVFIYSFFFGYLGGRSPLLKTLPLMLFVTMANVTNQQSYSFAALVDGALMMVLAVACVTLVYSLFSSTRPEQTLLRGLARFFRGCALVTEEFDLFGSADRVAGQRLRKRHLESVILPAGERIRTAERHLNYKLHPDNSPDKVQRLLDSLQSIAYRLRSLEIAHDRLAPQSSEFADPILSVGTRVRELLRRVFERWACFDPGDAFEQHRVSLEDLSHDLGQQFDSLESSSGRDSLSDRTLSDLYTILGSVRGLIEATANAQLAINQINWQQWATPRF
jgi:uncharacterized membrane protein YccC